MSILGKKIYKVEIRRYTVDCRRDDFTGKFRMCGTDLWVCLYLLMDFRLVHAVYAKRRFVPLLPLLYYGQVRCEEIPLIIAGLSCALSCVAYSAVGRRESVKLVKA